jgi:RNA polymerase sigma-70 factor (ECF subfamily)
VAWLYRVVKHRALNAARGQRRRHEREAQAMIERLSVSQEQAAFDREDTSAATAALAQLESGERELVVMRIWGSLTYDQIGVVLGVSTATAFRQYERALAQLRNILESPCTTIKNRANTK